MIVCLDVDYRSDRTATAVVGFHRWTDENPCLELADTLAGASQDYVPGQFFLRELPHLERVLGKLPTRPEVVVVDGYVWLGSDHMGLGARLHEALGYRVPVVGVAKTRYRGAPAVAVLRGASQNPLHVTAAGVDPETAAEWVRQMSGPHRIPTLIRRADQLCRGA